MLSSWPFLRLGGHRFIPNYVHCCVISVGIIVEGEASSDQNPVCSPTLGVILPSFLGDYIKVFF